MFVFNFEYYFKHLEHCKKLGCNLSHSSKVRKE